MGAGNPQKNVINNTYQNSKLLSFYGRLNYVLDDKYLFTFTMRADGSSKFGKNNKWGYFPSGAVSWKLHNEPWMKKLNVFDEFKIRASWGISGNGRRPSARAMKPAAKAPMTAISSGAALPTPI